MEREVRRWDYFIGVIIFLISLAAFLYRIQFPPIQIFDENFYVSAAKQIWSLGVNENWSHPILGKALVGAGIRLAGDNPLGWRLMSGLFGAITLVIFYLWALQLFRSQAAALSVAAFCMLNQLHFIEARTANLDIFMMTFISLGFLAVSRLWMEREILISRQRFALSALAIVAFAFAIACKWFALVPAFLALGLVTFNNRHEAFRVRVFRLVKVLASSLAVYTVASGVLFVMSPPHTSGETYGLLDFLALQWKMGMAQLSFSAPHHPYASAWWSWPLLIYPSWYHVEVPTPFHYSGIFYVGNLPIFWTGFLCAILSLYWSCKGARDSIFISVLFFGMWLCWPLIPRQGSFLHYYYPASMMLSFVLVDTGRKLKIPMSIRAAFFTICLLNFVFFYPVLTGQELTRQQLNRRIFFSTWVGLTGQF
jgi:dolichyl-phosphate-mannose--protein O-mannosyl transferase